MQHIRHRLSYANVLASLSLFLALGGGAYAAGTQTSAKTGPRITTISVPTGAPAGTLVARADGVRLETVGGGNTLRARNDTSLSATVACHGVSGFNGEPITVLAYVAPGATQWIVADSDEPATLTCRLADRTTGAVTDALIGGGTNALYAGHVISDGAQQ